VSGSAVAGSYLGEDPAGFGSAASPSIERSHTMLWTILIVLAIVALVLFILARVRGGRGV